MSDNRFVWSGLDELRAALRALPGELAAEAATAVTAAAHGAEDEVRQVYQGHIASGTLASRLTVTISESAFGAGAVVKNTAKHAFIFEHGTQARHWSGSRGTGKSTGAMWGKTAQPPTHTFGRAMGRSRRVMYERLRALVERQGLQVTGEP